MGTVTVKAYNGYDNVAIFISDIGRTKYSDARECYITDDIEYFSQIVDDYKAEYGEDTEIQFAYWLNGRINYTNDIEEILRVA